MQRRRGRATRGRRGGGGGGGRGGGGRRSDVALKHDITLLGRLDNGLGFYRFSYIGSEQGLCRRHGAGSASDRAGGGRARPGRLSQVFYDKLGLKFQTYDRWIASGARIPTDQPDRH